MLGRAFGLQNLAPKLMERRLPDGDWSTYKVSPKVYCLPRSKHPTLAWKKADVFRINGEDELNKIHILHIILIVLYLK